MLPRESPRPRKPNTRQAEGIANFLCHSTANRAHSFWGRPASCRFFISAVSSGSVISRSPLLRGSLGKNSSKGRSKLRDLKRASLYSFGSATWNVCTVPSPSSTRTKRFSLSMTSRPSRASITLGSRGSWLSWMKTFFQRPLSAAMSET